jgi:hypothetical protein
MVHTILGGLHGSKVVRTTSFEVLVLPPSPGSAGRVVGCSSLLSKTPSETRAQVEAFVDKSLGTALSMQGTWCKSRTSKSFSSF